MSAVKIIPAGANLIDAVVSELGAEGGDYSSQAVVFPGKRPAHFLRKALSGKEKGAFFPPKIFSMDEFIEHLYRERLGHAEEALQQVDAVAILFDIHKKAEKRLGRPNYDSFDNFIPLALKLLGELEEVSMANRAAREIEELLRAIQFAKFHSLAYYYKNFYEEVARRGFTTRSTAYRAVAGEIEKSGFPPLGKIVLAGFYAFTNVEKKIVDLLRKRENVKFIFQSGAGLRESLKPLGLTAGMAEMERAEPVSPEIHFYKSPDAHGQVFALASEIQKRLGAEGAIDHHTAVILPAPETLFPAIHFPLSLLKEEQFNIALGYPVKRTPAYGFLKNLLELVSAAFNGKFPVSSYLKAVLHPYMKNIKYHQRSDLTRIMFHQFEEYFSEEKPKALISLELVENDTELLGRCATALAGVVEGIGQEELMSHVKKIHDKTIRKFTGLESIGDFARKAKEILDYIFTESTANLHPYFRPYVERLMESLDAVEGSLIKDEKFVEPSGYLSFLQHFLEGETVPFHGTPLRGMQVLGLLETRNLNFDTVYFLDANDDVVPGRPREEMLLPQQIRKTLGLETYHDREKLVEYHFDQVTGGAKEVHLFYLENQKDGKKEKSRFVQKLLWKKQQSLEPGRLARPEATVRYGIKLENPKPDPIAKTEEITGFLRNFRQSASGLDDYLACELKFYYKNVLRLREKSEAGDGIDPLDVGILIHGVLEEYFKPFIGKKISAGELDGNRLEEIILSRMEREYGEDWLGPTFMMHSQVVSHLREFIEKQQKPLMKSCDVVLKDLEKKITVEKNGITFTGKIDRIELRKEMVHIIDYKTSKDDKGVRIRLDKLSLEDRNSYRDAIGSFQLPLYLLLYNQLTGTPVTKIVPSYVFLGKNSIDETIEVPIGDEFTPVPALFEAVQSVIFRLIAEMLDASRPFLPTDFLELECPVCPFSTLCGTAWVGGRRTE